MWSGVPAGPIRCVCVYGAVARGRIPEVGGLRRRPDACPPASALSQGPHSWPGTGVNPLMCSYTGVNLGFLFRPFCITSQLNVALLGPGKGGSVARRVC